MSKTVNQKPKLKELFKEIRDLVLLGGFFINLTIPVLGLLFSLVSNNQDSVFLIANFVFFLLISIYLGIKRTFTKPKPLINFNPYLKNLSELTHEDLANYSKVKEWYIPLEGSEFSYQSSGQDVGLSKKENRPLKWTYYDYFRSISDLETFLHEWLTFDQSISPILITSTAGTGKTTLLQRLAQKWSTLKLNKEIDVIPLFIPLRKWPLLEVTDSDRLLRSFLLDYFQEENGITDFTWAKFKNMIRNKQVVLLLDGFDEISRKSDYAIIRIYLDAIIDLMSGVGFTKVILTTRPEVFKSIEDMYKMIPIRGYANLSNYADFKFFQFNPIGIIPMDENKIQHFLEKRLKEQAAEFYEALKLSGTLYDLANRPLLLDMIVSSIETLDEQAQADFLNVNFTKANDLYVFYTDAWIARRNRVHNFQLKPENWYPLITEIAWVAISRDNLEISQTELEELIEIKHHNDTADYRRTLEQDLRLCTFLEHFSNHGVYRFNHKSFAEFFIADGFNREANGRLETLYSLDASTIINIISFASSNFYQNILSRVPKNHFQAELWMQAWLNQEDKEIRPIPEYVINIAKTDSTLQGERIFQTKTGEVIGMDFTGITFKSTNLMNLEQYNKLEVLKIELPYIDENSIRMLGKFPNLRNLTISVKQFQNLDLFNDLINLEELTIHGGRLNLVDFASLSNLTKLKKLELISNQVYQIETADIGFLTNLFELRIEGNLISEIDLFPFQNLKKLCILSLSSNRITDLDLMSLGHMQELRELDISNNEIKEIDLKNIKGLTNLVALYIYSNKITELDLSPIDKMEKLHYINARVNPLFRYVQTKNKNVNVELDRIDLTQ